MGMASNRIRNHWFGNLFSVSLPIPVQIIFVLKYADHGMSIVIVVPVGLL